MADEPQILTAETLAELDAQYKPFPPFGEWLQAPPRAALWERACAELAVLADNSKPDDFARAREIAMRAAAFDTGAIEGLYPTDRGLTLTVATQAAAWEQEVDERSPDARALFEAQLAAFDLVLDQATNRLPVVTQAWIRRLHEEIVKPQKTYVVHTPAGLQEQPLPKGEYKRFPNHVLGRDGAFHAYAPVDRTHAEMQRLVQELESEAFQDAHPLIQASYAHYAFVLVHPFADGNGRVARALASAYTYRAASVPLLILEHHREQYLDALARADVGGISDFVAFIARVARDGVELVAETLRTAQGPQPEAILSEFKHLYLAQGEMSHQQLDALADEFAQELFVITRDLIDELSVPDGVVVKVVPGSGANFSNAPPGFRQLVKPGGRYVRVELSSAPPANAGGRFNLDVFVSTDSDTAETVLVQADTQNDHLVLGLADLQPALSSAARLRLQSFTRRLLGDALALLLEKAKKRMRQMGYGR